MANAAGVRDAAGQRTGAITEVVLVHAPVLILVAAAARKLENGQDAQGLKLKQRPAGCQEVKKQRLVHPSYLLLHIVQDVLKVQVVVVVFDSFLDAALEQGSRLAGDTEESWLADLRNILER